MAEPAGIRFHRLPVETQVRVMSFLEPPQLRHLLAASAYSRCVFREQFPTLIDAVTESHPDTIFNNEIGHIVNRTIQVHFDIKKPYHGTTLSWLRWSSAFRRRSEATPPPSIPIDTESLVYLDELLAAVDWFAGRILPIISEACRLSFDGSDRFWPSESYRIRRALVLYQLYCELFFQSSQDRDFEFNGRVTEQAQFLQGLHPFLVGELEAIYRMIEIVVFRHYKFCCTGRKTWALQPVVPYNIHNMPLAGMEYFCSRGLVYLKEKMTRVPYGEGKLSDDAGGIAHADSRFFNYPISLCWKIDDKQVYNNYVVEEYSPLTPWKRVTWADAIEDTDDGSCAWQAIRHGLSPGDKIPDTEPDQELRPAVKLVVNRDVDNCRGVIFWVRSPAPGPPMLD